MAVISNHFINTFQLIFYHANMVDYKAHSTILNGENKFSVMNNISFVWNHITLCRTSINETRNDNTKINGFQNTRRSKRNSIYD